MLRHGKKNNYQLKFDTSKVNLECFIKKKSLSIVQSDKNDKRRKNSRGKPKSLIKKVQEFQQQKFISSIIKNAMQDQFQDPKQVCEMLSKMYVYGQQKNQSLTNDDDLLKCFQIFKEPTKRFMPQLGGYSMMPTENKQVIQKDQMYFQLDKGSQWHNFSTQIETQVGTERSDKSQFVEQYPSLLPGQYHIPLSIQMNQEQAGKQHRQIQNSTLFMGLSKEQRQRKSTPIRGQNEQFRIRLDKIQNNGRTTLMIRHIPNKYTQQMLIDEININHKLKYNFFYLPVDSYNPCNVGYAFINFIDTKFIGKFYVQFNGKRWNKFNSQKICQLAYARIQGSTALINHFQNSNVMNSRDKRYRPFISFGVGDNPGT